MAFCAGDMREHIVLQKKTNTKTGAAFAKENWSDVCEMSAKVADVAGKDFYAAYAANALDVVTFTFRWVEGVTKAWRIKWNNEQYEILQGNMLGARRDYMQCKCRLAKS